MRAEEAADTAAEGTERAAAFADYNAGAFVATDDYNDHTIAWNYTYTGGEIIRDNDFERKDAYEGVYKGWCGLCRVMGVQCFKCLRNLHRSGRHDTPMTSSRLTKILLEVKQSRATKKIPTGL